jgi:hypothetical protein
MSLAHYFQKEIPAGGRIPTGWYVAWFEPRRRVAVYSPLGLHWVFRFAREAASRARAAFAAPSIERVEELDMERAYRERQRLADEYTRGYLRGWRECLAAVEDELAETNDVWSVGAVLTDSARSH